MRNKIATFILFIIMIFLIGIIGFVVWALYNDYSSEDIIERLQISNTVVSVDEDFETQDEKKDVSALNVVTQNTNSNTTTILDNSSNETTNSRFFYKQLDETEKIIYDALQGSKEQMKTGTYTIEFGNQFSDILEQENGSEILGDHYQSAIDAYIHDNSDLFYIDVSKMYLNIETTKRIFSTSYNVYIGPRDGQTYYSENFSNKSDVDTALSKIDAVKNNVLSNLTGDDYENIKMIHDYLIENTEYDQNYESTDPYSLYSALIENKAVCEGYVKAFKYLTNAAGIECELVQGTATNSEGVTENHAWNCVYLDGKWYYIDVTWDDPIIIGNAIGLSDYNYRYFLKGSQTFNEDHVVETQFVDGGKDFQYPNISTADY